MFFGGNKNISKKIGVLILTLVFVFGLFGNFNNANAQGGSIGGLGIGSQSTDTVADQQEIAETRAKNSKDGLKKEYEKNLEKIKKLQERDDLTDVQKEAALENLKNIEAEILKSYTAAGGNPADLVFSCGTFDWSCKVEKAISGAIAATGNFYIQVVGLILRAAGLALDTSVNLTIVGMAKFLEGDGGTSIENSWTVFRDLINILFIFGLLYVSITIIIKGLAQNTKQLLVTIIASALLINFSFFFTKVAIDVSNYATIEIYNTISNFDDCDSLSGCMINELKISTALNPTSKGIAQDVSGAVGANTGGTLDIGGNLNNASSRIKSPLQTYIDSGVAIILGSIFIIIASFVLLALAIMLIIRFIMLIILLITSPVMFLGWVLPQLSSISKKWFKSLNEQLLFPPLAFLFIFITISVADGLGSLSNVSTGGVFATIINYLVVTGFLLASIIISKKVGATGADWATSKAGNLTLGASAKLGRTSIGRISNRMAQNYKPTTAAGKFVKTRLKNVGNATFDARNTKAFSGIGKATGVNLDFGKGQKQGFEKLEEKRMKDIEKEIKDSKKPTLGQRMQLNSIRMQSDAEREENKGAIDESTKAIKETKSDIKNVEERIKKTKLELSKLNPDTDQLKIDGLENGIYQDENYVQELKTYIEQEQEHINQLNPANVTLKETDDRIKSSGEAHQQIILNKRSNGWFSSTRGGAMQFSESTANPKDKNDQILDALKDVSKNTKKDD
jgi:hypothetical protein